MYRVLVVDDEPYVVHAIADLLEEKSRYELDVYYAYHGSAALEIFEKGRIDLLICDIRMPDISGLQLFQTVKECWPLCKTIFLTAHSNFDYAYQAISLYTAGYILKSEPEEQLLKCVDQALKAIDDEGRLRIQMECARSLINEKQHRISKYLFSCMTSPQQFFNQDTETLFMMLNLKAAPFCLVLALAKQGTLNAGSFFPELFPLYAITEMGEDSHGFLFFLMQAKEKVIPNMPLHIEQILESIQQDICRARMEAISFIISQPIMDPKQIPAVYQHLSDRALQLALAGNQFIYICGVKQNDEQFRSESSTVQFICEYIDQNISNDVSLLKLSTVTGYSSEYLSRLFHRETGKLLSNYIAERRLEMIRQLFLSSIDSLDEIATRTGFSSRSYFNRFIKKVTGMSAQNYRVHCKKQHQNH